MEVFKLLNFRKFALILVLLPFLVAAVLTALPYSERVGWCANLLYSPWGWLLDSAINPYLIPKMRPFFPYIFFLWTPALLYSVCIGVVLFAANYAKKRASGS